MLDKVTEEILLDLFFIQTMSLKQPFYLLVSPKACHIAVKDKSLTGFWF